MNRILLEEKEARMVLQHIADLWGYDVVMTEVDAATDAVLKDHKAHARPGIVPLETT
jgi:stage V sporulation protein R